MSEAKVDKIKVQSFSFALSDPKMNTLLMRAGSSTQGHRKDSNTRQISVVSYMVS